MEPTNKTTTTSNDVATESSNKENKASRAPARTVPSTLPKAPIVQPLQPGGSNAPVLPPFPQLLPPLPLPLQQLQLGNLPQPNQLSHLPPMPQLNPLQMPMPNMDFLFASMMMGFPTGLPFLPQPFPNFFPPTSSSALNLNPNLLPPVSTSSTKEIPKPPAPGPNLNPTRQNLKPSNSPSVMWPSQALAQASKVPASAPVPIPAPASGSAPIHIRNPYQNLLTSTGGGPTSMTSSQAQAQMSLIPSQAPPRQLTSNKSAVNPSQGPTPKVPRPIKKAVRRLDMSKIDSAAPVQELSQDGLPRSQPPPSQISGAAALAPVPDQLTGPKPTPTYSQTPNMASTSYQQLQGLLEAQRALLNSNQLSQAGSQLFSTLPGSRPNIQNVPTTTSTLIKPPAQASTSTSAPIIPGSRLIGQNVPPMTSTSIKPPAQTSTSTPAPIIPGPRPFVQNVPPPTSTSMKAQVQVSGPTPVPNIPGARPTVQNVLPITSTSIKHPAQALTSTLAPITPGARPFFQNVQPPTPTSMNAQVQASGPTPVPNIPGAPPIVQNIPPITSTSIKPPAQALTSTSAPIIPGARPIVKNIPPPSPTSIKAPDQAPAPTLAPAPIIPGPHPIVKPIPPPSSTLTPTLTKNSAPASISIDSIPSPVKLLLQLQEARVFEKPRKSEGPMLMAQASARDPNPAPVASTSTVKDLMTTTTTSSEKNPPQASTSTSTLRPAPPPSIKEKTDAQDSEKTSAPASKTPSTSASHPVFRTAPVPPNPPTTKIAPMPMPQVTSSMTIAEALLSLRSAERFSTTSGIPTLNIPRIFPRPPPAPVKIPVKTEEPVDNYKEDEFEVVPGRLAMFNNQTKYTITTNEIERRIGSPEHMNSSSLSGLLRRSKVKNGGEEMRLKLKQHGLECDMGRKKTVKTTAFTAMCEGEAMAIAEDFDRLVDTTYPIREVAESLVMNEKDKAQMVRDAEGFVRMMGILNLGYNACQPPINGRPGKMSGHKLLDDDVNNFSLMTHGFGIANQKTWGLIMEEVGREMMDFQDEEVKKIISQFGKKKKCE